MTGFGFVHNFIPVDFDGFKFKGIKKSSLEHHFYKSI